MENKVYNNENRMEISDIHTRVLGDNKAFIEAKVLIIDECSIDEGIEARIVSAFMTNEKEMCAIFTLRDVTGQGRITKGSCIVNCNIKSENINCDAGGGYGLIEIDEKTDTAIYFSSYYTEKGFDGNIIFKLNDIEQSMMNYKPDVIENIDLCTALEGHNPKIIKQTEVKQYGGSYDGSMQYEDYNKINLLNIDEMSIPFENVEWAKISNIGFVNGVLHIQVKLLLDRKSRNLLGVGIKNGDTKYKINADIEFYDESNEEFEFDPKARIGYAYHEYIYTDITDISQLKDVAITVNYINGGEDIPVSYTFEFAKADKLSSITIAKNVKVILRETDVITDEISISPLGLSLLGKSVGDTWLNHDVVDDVHIVYKDGHKENLISGQGSSSLEDDICYIKTSYIYDDMSPILMDGIQKVVINGKVFEVNYNL